MKVRCYDKTHEHYHSYGGRGIKVCKRWMKFSNFLDDVGLRPQKDWVLDRINNNGNYTPKNVRWVDRKTSLRNTRVNRRITINGVTKCGVEWAEQIGMDRHSVIDRYNKGIRGAALLQRSRKWRMLAKKAKKAALAIIG